ncbi:MAG TPA: hypothetical protein VGQ53_03925 [Chitinophagaceae bacterium]|jgi:hypothetical protein|nr:hypothetical protein [Chitinophagaceae bacterium]
MALDSAMRLEFQIRFSSQQLHLIQQRGGQEDFYKLFFENVDPQRIVLMLDKFQNNIKIAESKLVRYCSNKCPSSSWIIDDWATFFTSINIDRVKAGNEIKITAGIANFTRFPENRNFCRWKKYSS